MPGGRGRERKEEEGEPIMNKVGLEKEEKGGKGQIRTGQVRSVQKFRSFRKARLRNGVKGSFRKRPFVF